MGINIKFANVNYRVQDGKQTKILLNDISGEFRAGELSAVIGPSGCGKTTLLNLLAGYGIQTNSGCVYINDKPQNAKEFGQKSRYVLQHDDISPHFTVWETMMFASNFKLSHRCSRAQKEKVIYENLEKFHMSGKINSIMTKLSGGERKRISIAMEVMDNPPILFLDEPITGLDEFSATQCLRILKQLANCGHTIVCSLHCPSARLLQMVNKVYAMANGECIYQGRVDNIVPFLNDLNLNCPLTHNPTDFIIEVATKSYGEYQRIMVDKISNGHIYEWLPKKSLDLGIIDVRKVEILHLNDNMQLSPSSLELSEEMLPWFKEYNILFIRFMQQMWRDMFPEKWK
ncbi:ATP-binding cassette sub-family G member 1 [Stomoxys calcitrans]|uniref:ABC transporter domain-containing protein n=1 Tax=Stomoxys calcitrans TaxID=35570 RepID=A0A1I8PAT0_STOCA|nr:ATP-binding cassette sub-family G member 1 [Stomoxys calcitrans]